jgi:pyruvate kinase
MAYTKIVATIGPATCDRDSLVALAHAGMSVARLNGSHNDLEWHRNAVRLIRSVLPDVPILFDIPGRKIRTMALAHEPRFTVGDGVVLTTDTSYDGHEKVPVSYDGLHADVRPGDVILADDGRLSFSVQQVCGADIVCRAQRPGTLGSRKGLNLPAVKLNRALVTARDREMVEFCRNLAVDFIGVSFVESAEHVALVREIVGGRTPQVLAKIENQSGMDNLEEIIEAADAIMIDRGDLCAETNLESLVIYQKSIIDRARFHAKPVIVATEMLHSMIENEFPTKAEIADITNAVLDGCSATMLSGETAIGLYPAAAVRTMRSIADAAFPFVGNAARMNGSLQVAAPRHAIEDAIASILRRLEITKVVAITRRGYAARVLAARGVRQPILAVSDDEAMARSFNLYAGVEGVYFRTPFPRTSADHIKACIRALYETARLNRYDLILVTGVVYPRSGTRMNLIQIHEMQDLINEFGWAEGSDIPNRHPHA